MPQFTPETLFASLTGENRPTYSEWKKTFDGGDVITVIFPAGKGLLFRDMLERAVGG